MTQVYRTFLLIRSANSSRIVVLPTSIRLNPFVNSTNTHFIDVKMLPDITSQLISGYSENHTNWHR